MTNRTKIIIGIIAVIVIIAVIFGIIKNKKQKSRMTFEMRLKVSMPSPKPDTRQLGKKNQLNMEMYLIISTIWMKMNNKIM